MVFMHIWPCQIVPGGGNAINFTSMISNIQEMLPTKVVTIGLVVLKKRCSKCKIVTYNERTTHKSGRRPMTIGHLSSLGELKYIFYNI